MKKHILFVFLAIAAVACSKENQSVEEAPVADKDGKITVTFTASVNETKAMVSDGGAFTWSAGDRIAVYDENTGTYYPFSLQSGENANTATFSAQLNAADYRFTKAYYPCCLVTTNTPDQSKDQLNITGRPGYVYQYIPLEGNVEQGALSFDYLTAVVKVTIDRRPSRSYHVALKSTNPIAGTFDVASKSIVSNSSNDITIDIGDGSPLTYYFPVPAGQNAVTFEIQDYGGAALFTTGSSNAKTVTFKAPSLYRNEIKVPYGVYVNYSEPWDNKGVPYIYFFNADKNTGWTSHRIDTGARFNVDGWDYYKIDVDLSKEILEPLSTNETTVKAATIVVHNGFDNDPSGVPYADLYQVRRTVNVDRDLYIRVMQNTTQTTAKIYIKNLSNNGGIYNMQARYTASNSKFWGWGDFTQYANDEQLGFNSYKAIDVDVASIGDGSVGLSFGGNWNYDGEYWVKPSSSENVLVLLHDTCGQTRHVNFGAATMTVNGE